MKRKINCFVKILRVKIQNIYIIIHFFIQNASTRLKGTLLKILILHCWPHTQFHKPNIVVTVLGVGVHRQNRLGNHHRGEQKVLDPTQSHRLQATRRQAR
jgi:hypothetical protein